MKPLAETLTAFRADLPALRPTREHFVPDLALLGFLDEVSEHAQVVLELRDHRLCDRVQPSARAAYEAAQLAVLLATDADYDLAGARAWVYYLKQDRDLLARHADASELLDGQTPEERYRAGVAEMADIWESLSPGKGAVVRKAEALVDKQRGRPDNFLNVPVAPAIRDRFNADYARAGRTPPQDIALLQNNAYASLNRDAHPQTRLRPVGVSVGPDGSIDVQFEERNRTFRYESAAYLAAGAVGIAHVGLRRRLVKRPT